MDIAFHSLLFVAVLLAAFFAGKAVSRSKRAAVALACGGAAWLVALVFLVRRQDLVVRLARTLRIGDAILLLEVWIAWPAVFTLAALARWLTAERDRKAIRALNVLILAMATATATTLAVWPFGDLGHKSRGGICLQTSDYTCGAASAVNFLSALGIEATEKEMARECGVLPLRGVTMAGAWWGVEKRVREKGLSAALVRPSFEELLRLPPPVMLSTRYGVLLDHMVVLTGVKEVAEGFALIADPLSGSTVWSLEDLRARWLGEAIVAERPAPR